MAQGKYFSFGVDNVSFIDSDYNVFAVDDPQGFTLNLTGEIAQHRGGANNDTRASALHSRSAEVTLGTGYVDATLARLLTGGTVTNLGTSAASITTGGTGVNTLFGGTATLPAGVSAVNINSSTLVETTDYYVEATDFDKITVTRVNDGKVFPEVTLTNSGTDFDVDTERGIVLDTSTSATSLNVGEKGIISARMAVNSVNQTITFDNNKPSDLSLVATVKYNNQRRTITVPVAQPNGTIQGNSATEFQIQDITMQVEYSKALDQLASIDIQA